jgi:hypothetical protein
VEWRTKCHSLAEAFEPIELGFTNLIVTELKHTFAIITFNWKNFVEYGLEAEVFAFFGIDLRLQELGIRVVLDFDQVRRCDNLFNFSEIDSLRSFGWHSDL